MGKLKKFLINGIIMQLDHNNKKFMKNKFELRKYFLLNC
jgi:hypothetical protein